MRELAKFEIAGANPAGRLKEIAPLNRTRIMGSDYGGAIMKQEEKQEARRLRQELGMSVKKIAAKLKVSTSTASSWVRDIGLTEGQRVSLFERNPAIASSTMSEKARNVRRAYQKNGRMLAREGGFLHAAGCMLYWAEGSKRKNTVVFSNSDPSMLKFFMRFLRECYNVSDDRIQIRINCYTDCGLSVEEIEDRWLNLLKLPRTCLGKTLANYDKRGGNGNRSRKLLLGVCSINIYETELVQNIFGAIQEYSGEDNNEWIDAVPGKSRLKKCAAMVK